jgi:integrase/recombinase XerC
VSTIFVASVSGTYRIVGDGRLIDATNAFLGHLGSRGYSPITVRGYAYDLLSFCRFCAERSLVLEDVRPRDCFAWLEWQRAPRRPGVRSPAAATMNRRVAALRGLFEHAVISGLCPLSPVPSARRSGGLRARPRGMLAHLAGRERAGGRLVRQPARLPEVLSEVEVRAFLCDLGTHRDRAMTLAMVAGGLRAAEVRRLRLVDIDFGQRRLRVLGKGAKERVVPLDRAFFSELAAYLHAERPAGCRAPECFVVLHGPTRGQPMSEDALRKVFRLHRERSGAVRVRPHRLRHTYASDLVGAGLDPLVLQALMGHASLEATTRYVHLSPDWLAAEYARVMQKNTTW